MPNPVTLHGFRYSVYTRIARMVLHQKNVSYNYEEVNPFIEEDPGYLELHPFNRVPALTHDGFVLFETQAVSRYIDRAFPGDGLQPIDSLALARQDQVLSIVDNYIYWPLVRQVFSNRVFGPSIGEVPDEAAIGKGMEKAAVVLPVLEAICAERHVLDGATITLADCHLAPMIDYFHRTPEGEKALRAHDHLQKWWDKLAIHPMLAETDPGLETLSVGKKGT